LSSSAGEVAPVATSRRCVTPPSFACTRGELERRLVDERVVEHEFGLAEDPRCSKGEEVGRAGTCTNEPNLPARSSRQAHRRPPAAPSTAPEGTVARAGRQAASMPLSRELSLSLPASMMRDRCTCQLDTSERLWGGAMACAPLASGGLEPR
jgi:hypothetical protein